ncbi:hypothetical protein OA2633_14436 [Oceanicaulis alexandrii HTCC2633]|nr:hypothetical protein OA2633_14436 [Oceanicaulis alexandrii HTCC2633] [Oceanicaulis sp. HTCC2633]
MVRFPFQRYIWSEHSAFAAKRESDFRLLDRTACRMATYTM